MAKAGTKKLKPVGATGNLSHATSNELTDDQRHSLTAQHRGKYQAALAAKKKADADFKNICKVAKAELGDTAVADIKNMIAIDEDGEGQQTAIEAEIKRLARVARWMGLDIGAQGELFAEPAVSPSIAEKAFADGKRSGLANEVLKPPHGAGTEAYDEYVKGWHEGNAIYSTTKREQGEGETLFRPEGNEPAAPDAFDAAANKDAKDGDPKWPDDVQAEANKNKNKVSEPA